MFVVVVLKKKKFKNLKQSRVSIHFKQLSYRGEDSEDKSFRAFFTEIPDLFFAHHFFKHCICLEILFRC